MYFHVPELRRTNLIFGFVHEAFLNTCSETSSTKAKDAKTKPWPNLKEILSLGGFSLPPSNKHQLGRILRYQIYRDPKS